MRLHLAATWVLVAVIGLAACGSRERSPICAAQDALRSALREVDDARGADVAGDEEAVWRHMDEADRLVKVARANLAEPLKDPSTAAAARTMLEASNYLRFMVDDARTRGSVEFSMAQFAARELNRAGSGSGGSPLNC